ncbi:hypothetical protein MSAN_01856900 [Mycena sanguinolenta]|uniref:Uncharacterized protein n=1 Tax=Mycena sanguinolenta TaxID=230812 RepID=A0A8H6XTT9_9AGAR|nr:hypothetical protein MSAN_01856900 [Mycena sanguinolenta]
MDSERPRLRRVRTALWKGRIPRSSHLPFPSLRTYLTTDRIRDASSPSLRDPSLREKSSASVYLTVRTGAHSVFGAFSPTPLRTLPSSVPAEAPPSCTASAAAPTTRVDDPLDKPHGAFQRRPHPAGPRVSRAPLALVLDSDAVRDVPRPRYELPRLCKMRRGVVLARVSNSEWRAACLPRTPCPKRLHSRPPTGILRPPAPLPPYIRLASRTKLESDRELSSRCLLPTSRNPVASSRNANATMKLVAPGFDQRTRNQSAAGPFPARRDAAYFHA